MESKKILMPALSPTMTEGNINKWLVKIGDKVKAGDIIAEIETDKATMEVEAVDEGIITHLIDTDFKKKISVNSVIAIIDGKKEELIDSFSKNLFLSSLTKSVSLISVVISTLSIFDILIKNSVN